MKKLFMCLLISCAAFAQMPTPTPGPVKPMASMSKPVKKQHAKHSMSKKSSKTMAKAVVKEPVKP